MKKMSKRLVALLLAAVMVMGLSITTFAATPVNDEITVPVKIEIVNLPSNYSGSASVGVIYQGNVSISLDDVRDPKATNFIKKACSGAQFTSDNMYITSINGLGTIDEEYTDHYYKGYSWMIDLKAGNSVTTEGTRPSWATPAPTANTWFESPLAAGNVKMNGNLFFPYSYYDNTAGFTTSVEGIIVKYVMTETSW